MKQRGRTEITVIQKESALSVDEDKTIPATASSDNAFIFKATKGLSWSVSEEMDWLTLLGTTEGTNNTTGSDQTITYSVLINPNESARNGNIAVKAGNISKSITVEQAGSTFNATGGAEKIATTGGTTTGSVMATSGLAWTITPETDNDITVSPTSGSGDVTLEFSASDNAGSERMGTFIVSLDANQERTVTITATQTGKDTGAYIGNLQVCLTDEHTSNFGTANTNCSKSTKEGKTGWRLPTKDELIIMSNNKNTLQSMSEFTMFAGGYYRSSTVDSRYSNAHFVYNILGNNESPGFDHVTYYVRCVRNKD